METIAYTAPAISCGQCQRAVEAAVGALPGVEGVRVVVPTREVTVRFDPGQLSRGADRGNACGGGLPGSGWGGRPDTPPCQAPPRHARRGHTQRALTSGPRARVAPHLSWISSRRREDRWRP